MPKIALAVGAAVYIRAITHSHTTTSTASMSDSEECSSDPSFDGESYSNESEDDHNPIQMSLDEIKTTVRDFLYGSDSCDYRRVSWRETADRVDTTFDYIGTEKITGKPPQIVVTNDHELIVFFEDGTGKKPLILKDPTDKRFVIEILEQADIPLGYYGLLREKQKHEEAVRLEKRRQAHSEAAERQRELDTYVYGRKLIKLATKIKTKLKNETTAFKQEAKAYALKIFSEALKEESAGGSGGLYPAASSPKRRKPG